MFASKSVACIMQFKERLSRFTKGAISITEIINVNVIADDINLVIHTLKGLERNIVR